MSVCRNRQLCWNLAARTEHLPLKVGTWGPLSSNLVAGKTRRRVQAEASAVLGLNLENSFLVLIQ